MRYSPIVRFSFRITGFLWRIKPGVYIGKGSAWALRIRMIDIAPVKFRVTYPIMYNIRIVAHSTSSNEIYIRNFAFDLYPPTQIKKPHYASKLEIVYLMILPYVILRCERNMSNDLGIWHTFLLQGRFKYQRTLSNEKSCKILPRPYTRLITPPILA